MTIGASGVPKKIPTTPNNPYIQRVNYELSVINRTATDPEDNIKSPWDAVLLAPYKTAFQALKAEYDLANPATP